MQNPKPLSRLGHCPEPLRDAPIFKGFGSTTTRRRSSGRSELAGRASLADEEVAAMKKKARELFSGEGDAAFGDTVFNAVLANVNGTRSGFKSTDGETGDYSSVWTVERDWDNRTSLITNPSDGRLPAMTKQAEQKQLAVAAARK